MSITSTYVFPVEGLTYLMNVVPKNAAPSGISLGLWGQGSSGATTWASAGATSISGVAGIGNVAFTLNSGQTSPQCFVYEQAAFGSTSASVSGYSTRYPLTAASWGTPISGSVSTGPNSALPIVYCTYGSAINITNNSSYTVSGIGGIFLAVGASGNNVASTSGPSMTVLWYAPFTDLSTVTLASGDSLSVTPTWQSAAFQS